VSHERGGPPPGPGQPGLADPELTALQEIIRLAEDDRRRGIRYWFDPELAVALRDRVRDVSSGPAASTGAPIPARRAPARSAAVPATAAPAAPIDTPAVPVDSGPARPDEARPRPARPTWGPPPEAVGRAADWAAQLGDLAATAADCTECGLCETRQRVVFGAGGGSVPLVFVGEAPGHEEDVQGVPFVGRAGQLLTKMIEAIGLTREQVYICNVLKCRPPQNRNPLPEEIASCRHFLESQLEILQPKVICTLGLFAAQLLLGSTMPIGKLRGRLFTEGRWPLVPTFHPAYLLRNPSAKPMVWEDLQLVRRVLDS
jgi:uracil-DNA glycosylase